MILTNRYHGGEGCGTSSSESPGRKPLPGKWLSCLKLSRALSTYMGNDGIVFHIKSWSLISAYLQVRYALLTVPLGAT
jgi:hypothetical protein